ncbi:hypothetical protein EV2_045344 [Malus domestica]
MDVCAKFIDGVGKVVCPSSFAKHTVEYRKTTLLEMMQKMAILAAESMLLDQNDTKAADEVARATAAEAYSSQIQDIERAISEICFAVYAKDEKLIVAYNQVIHFKKVVDRLEP